MAPNPLTEADLLTQQLAETVLSPEMEAWFQRLTGIVQTTGPVDSVQIVREYREGMYDGD